MFTKDLLTPVDRSAILAGLCLTEEEFQAADAEWLYHRCANRAEVSLMVAAAVLQSRVEKLPPDPRLRPAPYPLRPSLRALQETEEPAPTPFPRDAADPTLPDAAAVVAKVGPCAAAPGSRRHARYQLWRVGATIGELRAEGLRISDMRRDLAAGRIVLSHGEATDD